MSGSFYKKAITRQKSEGRAVPYYVTEAEKARPKEQCMGCSQKVSMLFGDFCFRCANDPEIQEQFDR